MTNLDLASMKTILRRLMNKKRYGGVHVEITQLRRWGITDNALKYMVNSFLLLPKPSQGKKEYSVNSHNMKEVYLILNFVKDVSEL